MTIEQLHRELRILGISDDHYYLHGLFGSIDDNNKISLTIRQGKFTAEYEVYYREKGEKHSTRTFTNENEACDYVLKQIQEQLAMEKVQNVTGLSGMTVNERLYATGLMDEFERAKKTNKSRAIQILRILKVDEPSIRKILK